jgi:pimeloyl-ACP methyl ester carboxylesterase
MRRILGLGVAPLPFLIAAGLILAAIVAGWPGGLRAAEQKEKAKGKVEADDSDAPPQPEVITLTTDDGVDLKTTYYYPATKKGMEKTIPIIIVHGTKGDRHDFEDLATYLQGLGHAVIVPDLRGQGANTHFTLRPDDYGLIVSADMEAVKRFLKEQNNEKKLNIDALCIIGVGSGAVVALNYSQIDWAYPPLAIGKQGQDVKALVLVSPDLSVKGLSARDALADVNVRANLSILLIYGEKNSKAARDAKLVYGAFERYHAKPPTDEKEAAETQDLFKVTQETALQGAKLLNESNFKANLNSMIGKFIDLRLVQKSTAWSMRKNPLAKDN